jgi:hypothetical protein
MQIALPLTEALALATAAGPLPPMLLAVRADGATVEADIDAGAALGGGGGFMGLMGKAAGTVMVAATFASFSAGTAVFTIKAHARGLPVDSMLGQAAGMIPRLARKAGLPPDVAELRTGGPRGPELVVHVQKAVDAKVSGVVVQDLVIQDGTAHLTAQVGDVRLV